MIPEEDCWKQNLRELQAAKDAAERRCWDAETERKTEVERLRQSARQFEVERDVAERKMREAEAEAIRQVNDVKWQSVQQATEYEDRIRALERQIEQERLVHGVELRQSEEYVREVREEAEARVREAKRRCEVAVAEADARTREAQDLAEQARRRASDELLAARAREEARVKEIRQKADERIRSCEEQKRAELEQMQSRVIQRQRAMEETLYANGRQKSEAISEAKRHLSAMEQDVREFRLVQEAELAMRETRMQEWQAAQRAQNAEVADYHKGLLDLEKSLHSKTMERTMARVTRHLLVGDGYVGGSDTPTREVLHGFRFPANRDMTQTGSAPATPSSTLVRVGGVVATE